jgi:hypothetical protein
MMRIPDPTDRNLLARYAEVYASWGRYFARRAAIFAGAPDAAHCAKLADEYRTAADECRRLRGK